jgi:hypothetical protein
VWELISNQSNSRLAELCVEDLTHLPYEFREGGLQVEFANWNEPVLIAAPDVPSTRHNLDLPASTTPSSQGTIAP